MKKLSSFALFLSLFFITPHALTQSVVYVKVQQNSQLELQMDDLIYAENGVAEPGQYLAVTGGTQPYTYEWWSGGQVISNEPDPAFQIDGDAAFTLIVKDSYGCQVSRNITLRILDLDEKADPEIKIYPVPASHFISVSLPESFNGSMIRLTDIEGRLVWIKKLISNPMYIEIDLTDGIYLMEIYNDMQRTTKRIIVSHS